MIQTRPLAGQCPHCGAPAGHLAYHSRYRLRDGQIVFVRRCRQCRKTFCDRYGTAFYDLKTPEEKLQRALHQTLEGLCPEAVARIEGAHPSTVQRWVGRAAAQAQAADQAIIDEVAAANVELDEFYSFAGLKHPDAAADPEVLGTQFRQVSSGTRYPGAALQELLQPVSAAWHLESSHASTSGWFDRSLLDAERVANLQRSSYFKDHVGSTGLCPSDEHHSPGR